MCLITDDSEALKPAPLAPTPAAEGGLWGCCKRARAAAAAPQGAVDAAGPSPSRPPAEPPLICARRILRHSGRQKEEQGRVMVGASKGRMPNLRKDASPRGACSLESRPEVQARVQRRGGESARAVSKGSNPTPNRRPQIAGQKLPALTRNGARAAPVRGVQAEAPEHISPAPLPPPPRQTFPDPCLDS